MTIDEMIKSNVALMKSILIQYYLVDDPNAESIAYESLWKACEDFDEALGYKPSTLITIYIKRALGCYIRTLHKKRQLEVVSYNIPTTDNLEMVDLLPSDVLLEDEVIRKDTIVKIRQTYDKTLPLLSAKKQLVISKWEENDFSCTNKYLADALGYSQSHVNQILAEFKKLFKENYE